MSFSEQEER